jgi:tetratricopeptide (TPR) repeat protein
MVEATIFNNMAACCKKELNSKQEIEYSTKVIEMQEYLTDKNVLVKAYLRRGLAYEQLEKYLQAKEDLLSVKQMQADNKQASQCLNRCNKAIKDIYGDKVPVVAKNAAIRLSTDTSLLTTKKQVPVEKIVESKVSFTELKSKLLKTKEDGNVEFKKKDGSGKMMAISKFTEGINLYLKN